MLGSRYARDTEMFGVSSTSVNTLIQGTNGLIIGATPASYSPTLGTMNAPGFRITHGIGGALIDFHTNKVGGTNFDSRIYATSGTAAEANGTLELKAGTLNLNATGPIVLSSDTSIIFKGALNNQERNIVDSGNHQLNSDEPFFEAILVQAANVTVALPTLIGDTTRGGGYRFLFSASVGFTLNTGGNGQNMFGCWSYSDTNVWIQNSGNFNFPMNGEATVYNINGEWRISGQSPTLAP